MFTPLYYQSADEWDKCPNKRVLLFGMSGLGKTHSATVLRASGNWYHYSVDYRIGTRYLGEEICDSLKIEAMKLPYFAQLLRSDSIKILSNIGFNNLEILASYLGKPGAKRFGGLNIDEYKRRQKEHCKAERNALLDTGIFIKRSQKIYAYPHFICDTGGSLCEIVDPNNSQDPILKHLSEQCLMVWLHGSEENLKKSIARFLYSPKPMYYDPSFLDAEWTAYLAQHGNDETRIIPDDFVCALYKKGILRRQPLYNSIAKNWGLAISGDKFLNLKSEEEFNALIKNALTAKENA